MYVFAGNIWRSLRMNSKFVLAAVAVFFVIQFFSIKRWNISVLWDHEMKSYYAYLPATFILGDPALEKTPLTDEYFDMFYAPQAGEKRGHIQKTTMGLALLQAPFFLLAHAVAKVGGYVADGYSMPYKMASVFGAIFYAFLGLVFIRKSLRFFFSEKVVVWSILSVFFATNLYYYTFYEGQMSHVYSFFLISVWVYLTISWHRNPSTWKMVFIGLVLGLITLIRPVNSCVSVFFLLCTAPSQTSYLTKLKFLFVHWKSLAIAAVFFLLALAPQLAYWKYTSGDWLFYSYGDQRLFWLKPKILLGLFSYQKGWLVWTPLGWFALVGIIFLRQANKALFLPVLLSISLYIYIVFCWWCWWYGGSFGMRAMIDILPILALPMGAFFQWASHRFLLAIPVLVICAFLVRLNLFQTNQYVAGSIHWAGTTKKAYWLLFLTNTPIEDPGPYYKIPDTEKAMRGETGLD